MNHAIAGAEQLSNAPSNAVGPVDGLLAVVGVGAPLVAEALTADNSIARYALAGAAALAGLKLVCRLVRSEQSADPKTPPLHALDRPGQL